MQPAASVSWRNGENKRGFFRHLDSRLVSGGLFTPAEGVGCSLQLKGHVLGISQKHGRCPPAGTFSCSSRALCVLSVSGPLDMSTSQRRVPCPNSCNLQALFSVQNMFIFGWYAHTSSTKRWKSNLPLFLSQSLLSILLLGVAILYKRTSLLWMEEILHHLGWLNYLSTGMSTGFLPSTVCMAIIDDPTINPTNHGRSYRGSPRGTLQSI